ncbi:unnamed protein product, partial [marine sediment metagenome]
LYIDINGLERFSLRGKANFATPPLDSFKQAYSYVESTTDCLLVYCGTDVANEQLLGNCVTPTVYGWGGVASWFPHTIGEWAEGEAYIVGERITHQGAIYRCIVAHTSCTILCPDPDEPGVGGNWEDFWAIEGCT